MFAVNTHLETVETTSAPASNAGTSRALVLVLLAALAGAVYYLGLPEPLASALTQAIEHFLAVTAVPNWVLYLLVLAALPSAALLAKSALRPRPEVLEYTTDRFLGLTWRWRYRRFGRPDAPWAHCPVCDTALIYNSQSDGSRMRTVLTCESCDRTVLQHEGDAQYLAAKILRQIERKIRTGEWQAAARC